MLRPNQNGFRWGRSTTQCILAVQRIIDRAKYSGKKTALLFIDFSDAFNSVYWPKIKEALEQLGVPSVLVSAVMALMHDVTTRVQTPNGLTNFIKVLAGVLQGDTLAPFVFICVIDVILRRVLASFPGITFRKVDGSDCSLTDIDYADDIVVFFEERPGVSIESEIARFLAIIVPVAGEYGLKLNFKPKKTEILYINNPTPLPVTTPDGSTLHVTKDYKYLGSLLMDRDAEFTRRKAGAWAALRQFKPIWRSTLSVAHKSKVFNTLVVSIYTYGMETWPIGSKLLSKITGAYTQMVRFVKNVRVYNAATAVSNADLFKGFDRIEDTILKRRLCFAGHCQRSNQPVADLLLAPLPPKTPWSKPPLNMVSVLQADVQRATKGPLPSPLQLRDLMLDRSAWVFIQSDALSNSALNRAPEATRARLQARSKKAPRRNILAWEDLTPHGRTYRGTSLRKMVETRLCAACEQPKCLIHCLVCLQTHPTLTADPLLSCQLCRLPCATSCLPHAPTPVREHVHDAITPALAAPAFLCNECYVICRYYPMPPESRARYCP